MGAEPNRARHVAIIMDGNGRWAKKRALPRAMGHKRGVEAVRKLVRSVEEMGLDCLTLYAFSSENWKRPEEEVDDLMNLMRKFIKSDLPEFIANDVRLKIIGDWQGLAPISSPCSKMHWKRPVAVRTRWLWHSTTDLSRKSHGPRQRLRRSAK